VLCMCVLCVSIKQAGKETIQIQIHNTQYTIHTSSDSRAAVRQLFSDDAPVHRVQPEPAVRRGDVRVHQPEPPRLVEDIMRKGHTLVSSCVLSDA
jgi:hypothetical protein